MLYAKGSSLLLKEDAKHAPQRFRGTPQQLVADGKGGEVHALAFEVQLAQDCAQRDGAADAVAVRALVADGAACRRMSEAAARLCDGRGVERTLAAIQECVP